MSRKKSHTKKQILVKLNGQTQTVQPKVEKKVQQEETKIVKQQKNIEEFKSLDLTGRLVKVNDLVAYVFQNKQGKTVTITGVVVDSNKKGFKVMTNNGVINVRNVIKIQDNKQNNTQNVKKASILSALKGLFVR